MTRIRLIKKLAAVLNGVDVTALRVGDVLELPERAALTMIAEGWAEPAIDDEVVPKRNAARSHASTVSH